MYYKEGCRNKVFYIKKHAINENVLQQRFEEYLKSSRISRIECGKYMWNKKTCSGSVFHVCIEVTLKFIVLARPGIQRRLRTSNKMIENIFKD
jgi:hypothetical protein